MKSILLFLLGTASLVTSFSFADESKPNILFIAIDDLNDYISVLDNHSNVRTPNFERLAKRSVTFANAHCPAPACHPSRVAVMTGVHPVSSGIYRNAFRAHGPRWRHESPMLEDAVVLSQHFRNHGYRAVGGGKIFHTLQWTPGDSQNDPNAWDDYRADPLDPISADWPRPDFVGTRDQNEGFVGKRPLNNFYFGAAPVELTKDQGDGAVVDWAVDQMQSETDQPLFLAVGLFRPHIPFEVPRKWFDLYPIEEVELPPYRKDDFDDARPHERMDWHPWVTENKQWKTLMQGYLASISYVDHELGRLLDGLDASSMKNNTIVVLWTDHGFHIGEKGNWEKFALWEQTTRVPCFIHAPGVSQDGKVTREPVTLTDLYPTLCELAGLPIPDQCDGSSLVDQLKNPGATGDRFSLTSYHFRGDLGPSHGISSDWYRYIHYDNGFEELYDLKNDPNEFTNVINDPAHAAARKELAAQLPKTSAPSAGRAPESPYNLGKPGSRAAFKPGDPIGNQAFEINFKVDKASPSSSGVLVSQGGSINGYSVYLRNGKLTFAIRRNGEIHLAASDATVSEQAFEARASLLPSGEMKLFLNRDEIARANAGKLLPSTPREGFSLNADPDTTVGDYPSPFPFAGKVSEFEFRKLK